MVILGPCPSNYLKVFCQEGTTTLNYLLLIYRLQCTASSNAHLILQVVSMKESGLRRTTAQSAFSEVVRIFKVVGDGEGGAVLA